MTVIEPTLRRHRSLLASLGMILVILALCVAPYVFYAVFLMKILCFAIFAIAFNLLLGYVGLLSFGHAAFFGAASYVTAHSIKVWGFSPELGILAGVACALVLGTFFGVLAIRRKGIYFAMITLAFSQAIYFIALQAPFTGGEDGIQSVPQGMLFGLIDLSQTLNLYYVVLVIFLLSMMFVWRVVHSPFGEILVALRENSVRVTSLGYRPDRFKLVAFILSAGLAGLAGSTKAIVFQLATLTDVQWQMSGEVVLMTVLGGMGTFLGPVVGAAIVITLESYFAGAGIPAPVAIGTIFVICVLMFKRGIVGEFLARIKK